MSVIFRISKINEANNYLNAIPHSQYLNNTFD